MKTFKSFMVEGPSDLAPNPDIVKAIKKDKEEAKRRKQEMIATREKNLKNYQQGKVRANWVKEEVMAEASIVKKIKRAAQGWGMFDKDTPGDIISKTRGQDTDTLKFLQRKPSQKSGAHSPQDLQAKAIDRELKHRGVAEEVDQIDEDEKMIGRHGFTEIYRKGKNTIIAHGGNMGNTVANSVKPNVDKILGKGKFDKLKKHGIEKGSPDYSYAMTIPNKHFDSIHKIQESVESIDEVAAWQRSEGKNPEGGLNKKGIQSYRREHPGSKLSLAVTTKPSKLKKGSKAWNRRKSFCARMSGMKRRLTSAKTAHDPDSRINKSLRKWNC